MGLGIFAALKTVLPVLLYIAGIFFFFAALSGRVRWAMLFVVFLIPLRNVVEKLQMYPLGTKFLTIIILGMALAWIFMAMGNKINFMEKSSLNGISIILIIYLFISLQVGNAYLRLPFFDMSDARVQDWKNFCMMPLLYFIAASTITDKKWVWRVFTVMCVATAIMALYTTNQMAQFSSLVSRKKITGTFQFLGPNEVAAYFNQYAILLLCVYYSMKKGRNKWLLLGLIIISLNCVLFLFSRAAYLGTVVGLFLVFLFKNKKMLIPLFLAAVFWQAILPEKAIERIQQTTDVYGQLEASAARRLSIWEIALDHFEKSPVVGIGYGVFRHLGYDLGDTHNIYLKILVEQGLIGLIIFLILCACFAREGWMLYQKGDDERSRGLGLGLFVCTIVLLINNVFGDRFTYFELSSYFWIVAGLATRLRVLAAQPQPGIAVKKKSRKNPNNNV